MMCIELATCNVLDHCRPQSNTDPDRPPPTTRTETDQPRLPPNYRCRRRTAGCATPVFRARSGRSADIMLTDASNISASVTSW